MAEWGHDAMISTGSIALAGNEDAKITVTQIHVPVTQVLAVVFVVLMHSFSVWFMIENAIDKAITNYDKHHVATPHAGVTEKLQKHEKEIAILKSTMP